MNRASALCSLAVVAVLLAFLVSAEAASATTFCVPAFTTACPDTGTNVVKVDLQDALDTTNADGQADTVIIDAQTITEPSTIFTSGTDPLTIQGAGHDQTVLTTNENTAAAVLSLSSSALKSVTVRDLRVRVPNTMPTNTGTGIQLRGDTLENVDVVSRNAGTQGSDGIGGVGSGSVLKNVSIGTVNGGALNRALETNLGDTGTLTIDGITVSDAITSVNINSPGLTANIYNGVISNPGQLAFSANQGTMNVDNATVTTSQPVAALEADVSPAQTTNAAMTADHVTAVYTGPGNVAAIASNVFGVASGSSDLRVTNSVFAGNYHGWQRQGSTGGTGSASLTVSYSDLPQLSGADTGSGTLTLGPGTISANPLLTSATDYHLLPGSPSIDAGDPAETTPSTDFGGAPRPEDGNGDGTAIADQGAFEVQDTTAPETTIDAGPGPKGKLKKGKAKFTFSSAESNVTFQCKVDKKDFAPCTSPLKLKKLKKGKHTVSVEATDVDGNVDLTPATDTFKSKLKKKHHKHHGGHGHHGHGHHG